MPTFEPGVQKTAVVTMTNPKAAAFDYTSSIYMGVDLHLMTTINFHLDAGETKQISFSITMPGNIGTYPVHLDVWSGGTLLNLFHATEDVTISGGVVPAILDFTYPMPCYSGATHRFSAQIAAPKSLGKTIAFSLYIPKESIKDQAVYPESYCKSDKVLLSASLAPADQVSPDDLYTLYSIPSSTSPFYYDWYGKTTSTGWGARRVMIPAKDYPVYGKITVDGVVLSNVQVATITVVTTSDSLLAYSNMKVNRKYVGDTPYAYLTANITNNGPTAREVILTVWHQQPNTTPSYPNYVVAQTPVTFTIGPGQTVAFTSADRNVRSVGTYYFWLVDDLGGKTSKYSTTT